MIGVYEILKPKNEEIVNLRTKLKTAEKEVDRRGKLIESVQNDRDFEVAKRYAMEQQLSQQDATIARLKGALKEIRKHTCEYGRHSDTVHLYNTARAALDAAHETKKHPIFMHPRLQNGQSSRTCPQCGYEYQKYSPSFHLDMPYCSHCGKSIDDLSQNYCGYCGVAIDTNQQIHCKLSEREEALKAFYKADALKREDE